LMLSWKLFVIIHASAISDRSDKDIIKTNTLLSNHRGTDRKLDDTSLVQTIYQLSNVSCFCLYTLNSFLIVMRIHNSVAQ
jgi:hypothetical protein